MSRLLGCRIFPIFISIFFTEFYLFFFDGRCVIPVADDMGSTLGQMTGGTSVCWNRINVVMTLILISSVLFVIILVVTCCLIGSRR